MRTIGAWVRRGPCCSTPQCAPRLTVRPCFTLPYAAPHGGCSCHDGRRHRGGFHQGAPMLLLPWLLHIVADLRKGGTLVVLTWKPTGLPFPTSPLPPPTTSPRPCSPPPPRPPAWQCMAPTYVGDFHLAGVGLRKRGLNRIGNMLVGGVGRCRAGGAGRGGAGRGGWGLERHADARWKGRRGGAVQLTD